MIRTPTKSSLFFFTDTATTEIYTLSLHDALPISIYRAAPLHDIGKVGIPDRILQKPSQLTPEEWEVMRTHPVIGGQTLEEAEKNAGQEGLGGLLQLGKEIAFYHHERWDGSGYPFGMRGEEIPLCARIVAIADSYDAISSRRVYKGPSSHADAQAILEKLAGVKFEATLVSTFLAQAPQILAIRDRYLETDETQLLEPEPDPIPESALELDGKSQEG